MEKLQPYIGRFIPSDKRKRMMAAIGIVLAIGLLVGLNSFLGKKPKLIMAQNIPVKKNTNTQKPAGKKAADGKPASEIEKIVDDAKKATLAKLNVEGQETAEDEKPVQNVIYGGEIMSAEEVAKINAAASGGSAADDSQRPSAVEFSPVEPEQVDLSANVGDVKSGIQSLVFMRYMPIVDALQLLAARYGQNIVPMTQISGNIGFTKLNNVSFDEAMNAILGGDFKYEQEGNIVKVYSAGASKKAEPIEEEMECKVFTLYYITAAEAKKMILPVISNAGKLETTTAADTGVPVDETVSAPSGGGDTLALNDMIVVYDYPVNIAQVEKILTAIDVRPKQVLVEATILTATLTDGMQFGIDWRNLRGAVISGITGLGHTIPDYYGFGGTSTQVGSGISAGSGLTIGIVEDDIAAFIRAVEEITDVTILANPKILATNKQLGQVYIGTKVAYQSSTTQTESSTTQQVDFIDTGTKLSFRPYIGNDGYIRMDIHPKDSSATIRTIGDPETSTVAMPDETSAELVTNIIVKDGETIAIGGLFRNKTHTAKKQVPVLGDIPILGTAFKSNADETKREEVIILLTPHIISEPSQTRGEERSADVARKSMGAKEELHSADRMKLAEDNYEQAALYYAQGRNDEALKKLETALWLYPSYLEAIRLEERIYKETDKSKKPMTEIVEEIEQPKLEKWRRR
ncbi:MAG: hypothetical protein JW806_02390 [Sedimentisphaerales bacterium]|nr:hypothetical protein [Sedimentisphaerales bacterium]